MKLKVLVDNKICVKETKAVAEHGLSFYIESMGDKILFDTGYSDAIIKNALVFNVDLSQINYIILSHAHSDHSHGLKFILDNFDLSNTTLIAHPDVFLRRKDENSDDVSVPLTEKEIRTKMKVILTEQPYQINEELTFLGQINRHNDFESIEPMGYFESNQHWYEDYLNDDTCLIYHKNDKITIFSGCSHSGICNMIDDTKKLYPNASVNRIVGGLRLFELDDQLFKTKDCFMANNVEEIYPCHCVSFKAMAYINDYIPCLDIHVGSEYEWD